ncbi:hypothetical protein QOM21_11630 [Streptomyces sp. Pv4-95]|uniref:hypothetical protein n=1 Tax=Streptomyces sp. Pv4-95 TaxID=3049543 RepID=UPI0038924CF3
MDLLARLPHRDRRLLLSEREITALAPAVTDWLARGVPAEEITAALTQGLPARLTRPSGEHYRASLEAEFGEPVPIGAPIDAEIDTTALYTY